MREVDEFLGPQKVTEDYARNTSLAVDQFEGSDEARAMGDELWAWIATFGKRVGEQSMSARLLLALQTGKLPETRKAMRSLTSDVAVANKVAKASTCSPLSKALKAIVEVMIAVDDRVLAAVLAADACRAWRAAVRVFAKTVRGLCDALDAYVGGEPDVDVVGCVAARLREP